MYYLFVLFAFLYLLHRHRESSFQQYIILMFFGGLMSFFGKDVYNSYKIVLTLLSIYWLSRATSTQSMRGISFAIGSFFLFSFMFLLSGFVNQDYFLIIFSQYAGFFMLFVIFLLFMKYRDDSKFKITLSKLIYDILTIQILLSAVKLVIIGVRESIIGSISAQGGAMATSLPILGYMFIWLRKDGVLQRKDWVFIVGLAFIGFVSLKRAIWFVLPIVIGLFMVYIPKRKISARVVFLALLVVPFTFYAGVRLDKTLNKEHKVWGSFDLDYAYDYAYNYMFGKESFRGGNLAYGRGGAVNLIIQKFTSGNFESKEWLGHGLRFMYTTNYEEFFNLGFGIQSKGAASGVFQGIITGGYLGVFSFILFAWSIFLQTRNKRLRICLLLFLNTKQCVNELFFNIGQLRMILDNIEVYCNL